MGILVYGIGAGFILSSILSVALIFFLLKESMEIKYVPKVERKENKVNVKEIEEKFSRIFKGERENVKIVNVPEKNIEVVSPPDIKLKGVIISENLKGAVFYNGKEIFVKEGEKVKGYRLIKVGKDFALLEKGGKIFRVGLEISKNKGFTRNYNVRNVSSEREIVLSKREILRITKDPAKMFTQIRLVPYVKNGKTEGFIFEWVKPGSIFDRIGIRRGDILVSVNNMTISSGEDAFRLLYKLRNEPNLQVVLIRNGRREVINVRIE